jgi:hypothetical protein
MNLVKGVTLFCISVGLSLPAPSIADIETTTVETTTRTSQGNSDAISITC